MLAPLIAHELEHIRRRDQLVAAIQALADALVFFSPGTRWLSRQVCLAREQACDDAAVRVCGDAAAYAAALGSLVGVISEKPTFLPGAEAPPLAARIRRVLEGETRKRMTCRQRVVLALAVLGTCLSGFVLGALSFADTLAARDRTDTQNLVSGSGNYRPRFVVRGDPTRSLGIPPELPGAPVIIIGWGSSGASGALYTTLRVRNVSEDRVTSVRFAAVVEFVPREGAPTPLVEPALVVRSRPIPVSLAPGQDATVSPAFLTWADIAKWARTHAGEPRPRLTLIAAERAGSGTWEATPEPGARDFAEAFSQPAPRISRTFLGVRPADPLSKGFCRGERGWSYWPGAIVSIDGEKPPALARCAAGVWRAYEPALYWGAR